MNGYHFCFSIRISCKVKNFRTRVAAGKYIFLVAYYGCNGKTLYHSVALDPITVYHIIYSTVIVLFKYAYMYDILANKGFIAYFGYKHIAISAENNNIIKVGAFAYKLILTHA